MRTIRSKRELNNQILRAEKLAWTGRVEEVSLHEVRNPWPKH